MDARQDLGKAGEELAAGYLEKQGMMILERNWRFGHKEIDIIAREGNDLVIVEVKTRRAPVLELPDQAIPREKRRYLVLAANAYARYNHSPLEVRFDIVNVVFHRGRPEVEHVRDAFIPGGKAQGSGLRAQGSRLKAQGSRLKAQGSRRRAQGSGR
jgi:putative endonuclease